MSATLPSRSLICSSALDRSYNLLMMPSGVSFISVIVFFSYDYFLNISCLFYEVLTEFIHSSPEFGGHPYDHLQLGIWTWGLDPSLLIRELGDSDTPPSHGFPPWGCGFWLDCLSALPTHILGPFLCTLSCRESVLLVSRLFQTQLLYVHVIVV